MRIIHASDLHFGNSARVFEHTLLLRALAQLRREAVDEDVLFIVSGDIGFKGQAKAYGTARKWFEDVVSTGLIKREHILVCPGNHDLCDGSFDAFDVFSFGVRKDAACTFGAGRSDVHLISFGRSTCLLMNSAHHFTHEYGLAPLEAAERILNERRVCAGSA